MTQETLRGLDDALKAFERSRDRGDSDAVVVPLTLITDPAALDDHTELAGAEFGMQDAKGVLYGGEPQPGGLRFNVGVVAARNCSTGKLRFFGPYAHGPAGEEFLYLNWKRPGQEGWVWRIKMSLSSLSWEQLVEADRDGRHFEFDATGRVPHDRTKVVWKLV